MVLALEIVARFEATGGALGDTAPAVGKVALGLTSGNGPTTGAGTAAARKGSSTAPAGRTAPLTVPTAVAAPGGPAALVTTAGRTIAAIAATRGPIALGSGWSIAAIALTAGSVAPVAAPRRPISVVASWAVTAIALTSW